MINLAPLDDSEWSPRTADHLLSRACFGGSPAERRELFEIGRADGVAAAVDHIVDASVDLGELPLPPWAQDMQNGDGEGHILRRHETVEWLVQHAMQFPLVGKMLKFYIDHFPVSLHSINEHQLYIYFYRHFELLRSHALGNFGELVRGVTWSEAMIRMLNLSVNRRGLINEDFGRELLELFTLGVDGGYVEADVTATARAFTGRRLPVSYPADHPYLAYLDTDRYPNGSSVGEYRYIDFYGKNILGKWFSSFPPGEGEIEEHGDQVVTHILDQPQCGEHMVWKLWRYFVSPDPAPELLTELGERFRVEHNYEIKPLLKDIFCSAQFYADDVVGQQVKDPIDFVVCATKALEMELPPSDLLYAILHQLGMNLLFPPNIAGWPEPIGEGNQWLSAQSIMLRMNLPLLWTEGDYSYLGRVAIPGNPEPTYPRFDADRVIDSNLMGARNFDLLYESLVDRLLPLNRPERSTKRVLHDLLFRRARRIHDTSLPGVRHELVRQLMSIPEFQLQ